MAVPRIKSTAVLIGYNSVGKCVYSEIIDIHDYYDGEQLWDDSARVKSLKLNKVKGFLFAPNGKLDQEFETTFDVDAGEAVASQIKYSDGTEGHCPVA